MKRVCLLACCAVLGGCMHSAPEVKKESAAPAPPAVKQEKPELSVALVEKTIIKEKTTREELLALLGPPNSVKKHPYHVPKVTAPGFKMDVPPEMLAVETWYYWTPIRVSAANVVLRVLMIKFHIDETNVVQGYEITEKDTSKEPGI